MSDSTLIKEQDQAILRGLDEAEAAGTIPAPQQHSGLIDNPVIDVVAKEVTEPEPKTQEAAAPVTPAAPAPQEQARGNVTAALRASRHAEREATRRAEEATRRADELAQQLADAKAGKPLPVDTTLTEADIEAAQDFPVLQKIVARQLEAEKQQQTEQPKAAEPTPGFVPSQYSPEVQDAIDQVPDLLAWQYDPTAQDKFEQAVEADKELLADPAWKDKPLQERLVEVVRRINAPPPTRVDPAAAIAAAPLSAPKSIADFRGGADPGQTSIDYSRMSDDQIMAALPG